MHMVVQLLGHKSAQNDVQFRIHVELHVNGALQDLYKSAQKGAPEIALKGALQVALELHLFIQLSMHKSVQYD